MGANKSGRQVRTSILSAPVDEYILWELLLDCHPCDRQALAVPVSALGGGTIAAGLRRLRCSGCGGRPSKVMITNRRDGWRQTTVTIAGEGAYR